MREMLRGFEGQPCEERLPQIYFATRARAWRKSDFERGRLFASEVFVFVDREFVPEQLTATVPAGNYACIYCDDFYKEQVYRAPARYIRQSRCRVCGDYLCESIADIPWQSQTPQAVPAAAGACLRYSKGGARG